MENSTKNSGGVVIPKRKRSLDIKSLYKSTGSEVIEVKKKASEKNLADDVEKRKRKSKKEVSLSSFQFDGKKSYEDGYGEKSETESVKKPTGGNKGLLGILPSLADNDGLFNIPKRPRGSVGCKKTESDQLTKPLRLQNPRLPISLRLQDLNDHVGPGNVDVIKPEIESSPNNKLINAGSISAGNGGISKLKTRSSEGRKKLEKEWISKPSVLPNSFDRVSPINASVTKSKGNTGPKDLDTLVSISAGNGGISKLKSPSSDGRKKLGKERISKPAVLPDSFDRVAPINASVTKSKDDLGSKDLDKVVAISAGSGGVKKLHSLGKNNLPNPKSKKKVDLRPNFDVSSSSQKLKRKAVGNVIRESKKTRFGLAEKEDKRAVSSGNMSLEKHRSNSSKKDLVVRDGKEASTKKTSTFVSEVEESRNVRSGAVEEEENVIVNNVNSVHEKQQSKSKKKNNLLADRDGKGISNKKKGTSVGEVQEIKNVRVGVVSGEENLAVDNGHTSTEKQRSNSRKQKNLLVGGDGEEVSPKKTKPSEDGPVSDGLIVDFLDDDDDDEENLEQNAARMLSSRFDPSCTGFSSKKRTSKSERADGFTFPVSSGRETLNQHANSSVFVDSGSVDVKSIALRPRGEDKGKHVQRKRRHFYEVLPTDFDALWVVNRRIKIFWPLDESWYDGLVKDYHPEVKLHHIKYDDRDEEWVDLHEETFKLLLLPNEVPGKTKGRKRRTRNKDADGVKASPISDDDSCTGNYLDSEPIASWLARSNQCVKSSPSLKKRRNSQMHPPTTSSLSGGRTENSLSLGNVSDSIKQDCESAVANDLEVNEVMLGIVSSSRNGTHLVTYRRKKYKRSKKHSFASIHVKACGNVTPLSPENHVWSIDEKGNLKLNVMLVASTEFKFKTCLAVLPCLEFSHGTDDLWLLHCLFMLQHGTVVITSPAVQMEMLFIDNNHGLRFLLFEGCLRQALAIVFLILLVVSRPDDQWNGDVHIPVTSIRFRILGGQDLRKHHVIAFYSFSGLKISKWLYLDFKLLQQCRLLKQLPVSECTYDIIKNLEDKRKLVTSILPMRISGEACNTRMSPSTSCLPAKPREVPHFALSFGAESSLFLNLHLQFLMEHSFDSINHQHHAAPCLTEYAENDSQPSGENHAHDEESQNLRMRKPEGAAFGKNLEIHAQLEQGEPTKDVNERSIEVGSTSYPGLGSRSSSLAVDIPSVDQADIPCDAKGCVLRQTSDTGSRSPLKPRISSPISSLGDLSPVLADGKTDFVRNGFSNGPKKPRTHVRYTMPSAGYDFSAKKMQNQRALPCKRIRRASLKRLSEGPTDGARESPRDGAWEIFRTNQKKLESLACGANVLVTQGDKGWRLCGAHVVVEVADRNECRLAVKLSGITEYSYKVNQIFQPGSTNRFSHAMMWKGGKDWVLEFPDRSQWMLFKEMHEECYNRNIRAASVKHIPIPGVRVIDEDDWGTELPFVRNSMKYYQQVQTDVEMAMDPSRVLYDMDSDDDQWLLVNKKCTEEELSQEVLEKTIDMFEKVSCIQQREKFTDAEIEDIVVGISSLEAGKLIYGHWRQKRDRKGMPLVRHLQPPLWMRYQQQLKEWEKTVARNNGAFSIGNQGKVPPQEKPPMFAFCLKPRGLNVPSRGSKQRSHRKFLVSAHHHAASGDHDSLLAFGRRSNGHAFGDEQLLYPLHEYADVSPSLQASMKGCSPLDARFSLDSAASEWNRNPNIYKNRSKKLRSYVSLINQQMMPYNQRTQKVNRNPVQVWSTGMFGQKRHYFEGQNRKWEERLDGSDLQELQLRDASNASLHARKMAKLKRERAQRLLCRADFCVHKAVTAMITAEAIKAAHESSNCEN